MRGLAINIFIVALVPIWGTGVIWFVVWFFGVLVDWRRKRKRTKFRREFERSPDQVVRTVQQRPRYELNRRETVHSPQAPKLVGSPRQIPFAAIGALGGLLSGIAAVIALFIGK